MKHFESVLKVALVVIVALPFGSLGAQQPPPKPPADLPEAAPPSWVDRANAAADDATKHAGLAATAAAQAGAASDAKAAKDSADTATREADLADAAAAFAAFAAKEAKLQDPKSADAGASAIAKAAAAAKTARNASDVAAKFAAAMANPKTKSSYTCNFNWNDCDWQYWIIGGGEESALSSQDSQTNPFVSLFVRAPNDNRNGSLWLLARFLGAANANNTGNIVAATQSALGSSSASGLPQVGTAVDYVIGFERDFFQPSEGSPEKGGFTIGGIVGFGATTPLSTQHATTAYVVPPWGTNECDELRKRFPSSRAGLPVQPSTPYITTTTTPSGGTATATTSGPFCIINPVPITTTTTSNGSTSTVTVSGTAQTDIAFAPEDRNSFLLKYFLGVRLINRWHNQQDTVCGTKAHTVPCTRTVVDLTVGQDEAITGGMLRHFVGKADAVFPIPGATSICFFGSASLRLSRNQDQSPLILQPATIVTASPTPPATISLPSTSSWILPLTQPNRDFYRIGIGVDLTALLAKAFASSVKP